MKHNPSAAEFQKPQNPFVRYPNRGSDNLTTSQERSPNVPTPAPANPASVTKKYGINAPLILKFMLDMKYARKRQIVQRFGKSTQTESDIGYLLERGYIKARDNEMTAETLFVPTADGYNALLSEAEGKLLAQPLVRIFEPTVRHNVLLGDIRIRFEELNFIRKWNSEEMLKVVPGFHALMKDLPDAMCERVDGQKYFLELEISQKTRKQYDDRMREYDRLLKNPEIQSQGITGVMFLCTDLNVISIIKSLVPKECKIFSILPLNRYIRDFPMTSGKSK